MSMLDRLGAAVGIGNSTVKIELEPGDLALHGAGKRVGRLRSPVEPASSRSNTSAFHSLRDGKLQAEMARPTIANTLWRNCRAVSLSVPAKRGSSHLRSPFRRASLSNASG